MKNPFDTNTPEWQLFENMKSSELLAVSQSGDAERYALLAAKSREKAGLFKEALTKLSPDLFKDEQK